jgi:hypothetical protein
VTVCGCFCFGCFAMGFAPTLAFNCSRTVLCFGCLVVVVRSLCLLDQD